MSLAQASINGISVLAAICLSYCCTSDYLLNLLLREWLSARSIAALVTICSSMLLEWLFLSSHCCSSGYFFPLCPRILGGGMRIHLVSPHKRTLSVITGYVSSCNPLSADAGQ